MSKVLFIKANNRPATEAVSVQMYDAFLQTYRETHSEDQITELDLFEVDLPYYDASMMTGLYKLANGITPNAEEQKLADTANQYLNQFLEHDKIVFAFPLWNFTIPAQLLTYIFYLTQAGKTFKYTEAGPQGLLSGKKVALLNAAGSVFSEETMSSFEMSSRYMNQMMRFYGITNVTTIIIEGHGQYPDRREEIIAKGIKNTANVAAQF